MIAYFADRKFNIIGQASTQLPAGNLIKDDLKSEDVETGIAIFDGYVQYTAETREQVENFTAVGNYILRKNGNECEFYTIIESEASTKNREVYVYAEDAGLDLINEVVGAYEADKAHKISYYIEKFAYDSGFEIGINEAESLTRKLSWDGEATVTERLASVATQFDCEISYSFDVKGLEVTHKYINIHKKRGKDLGIQLRLNYDIDNIVTKKSIANLATGLEVTGGTPENEENPITLKGYKYDDGDFFVSGTRLYSRKANQKWSRYIWNKEPNKLNDNSGYIVKTYSYDTTSQSDLCAHAVTELKKICDIEVNYEVEIAKLPDNVRIGDRVDIVDDAGGLYASARVLKLESSAWTGKNEATIGEFLIKTAGISQKVLDLAEDFAKTSLSAERARKIAEAAKQTADAAQTMADEAVDQAAAAQTAADAAQEAADTAQESAGVAQEAANQAQTAVDAVEEGVESLQTTVETARTAAENAHQAAETAGQKADQAAQAAADALEDSAEAKTAADAAKETAEAAAQKSDSAQDLANTAKTAADAAKETAEAAKQDAQTAQNEIDSLGESLTTLSNTMEAEYARKTDLTEAEASLQTQISQNAAQISSTASKVEMIDETANDAADKAAAAQTAAGAAQSKADQAAADAAAAQSAADTAKTAAENAQKEADTAHSAAQTAQGVADKAKEDLDAAKADLATVQGRVDATEEDIAAAQAAVDAAQVAADKAQEDADAAVSKATAAQTKADSAAESAQTAQEAANDAASKANQAQQVADEAKGDAAAAQATAEAAQQAASTAQNTANTAKNNAAAAQSAADAAAQTAVAAQSAADEADAKAAQAAQDLATAQQNLASVTSRVDATEEEVAAAQAAVEAAQSAADQAKSEAQAAQSTADTAKNNATLAQQAADAAKDTADAAQEAANQAQAAADQAQEAVDALAVRVTEAETNILQNAEAVEINASKTEEIGTKLDGLEIGGRNLIVNSTFDNDFDQWTEYNNVEGASYEIVDGYGGKKGLRIERSGYSGNLRYGVGQTATVLSKTLPSIQSGETYTLSAWVRVDTALDNNRNHIFLRTDSGDRPILTIPMDAEVGTWIRYQNTHTFTSDRVPSNFLVLIGLNGAITVSNLKLEKGNKATDWTPAPEDLESATQEVADHLANNYYNKTETDAKIKVESDRITSTVSKVETVEKSSITSTVEQFYLSTSPTALSGGSWSTTQPTWTQGKYIWRRTRVTKGDGTQSYTPSSTGVCITGNTGATGAAGTPGKDGVDGTSVTIVSTSVTYQVSNSGTTKPTGEWVTTVPTVPAGKYLWTRTIVKYSDGKSTESYSISRSGVDGSDGSSVTITKQEVTYQASSSGTTKPSGTWSTTIPSVSPGQYLWTKTVITYSDGKSTTAYSVARQGQDGADGKNGVGIDDVLNYYLATASSSGVTTSTSGWTTTIQTISSSKKYLWNYEKILYTDGSSTTTVPCIIGTYGRDGSNGAPGDDGVGISAIQEYYQVSSSATTAPTSWVTTPPTMTATKKYLWNYEKITYTNGTTKETAKRIIGANGDKGATGPTGPTGISITSVDVQYYLSSSATSLSGGSWSSTAPDWVNGKYMWSKTVTTLSNGTKKESDPVCITGGKGSTGATGATGKGVSSITEEYYLSTSKTTQTGGSWTTKPPTWSSGKYVWTRSKIVYTNPSSTAYTTPICDSSWEAVNEVEVGGRNFVPNSSFNNGFDKWIAVEGGTGDVSVVEGYDGRRGVKISRTGYTDSNRIGASVSTDSFGRSTFYSGETVTLSAYVRVDTKLTENNIGSCQMGTQIFLRSNGDHPVLTIPTDASVGEWIRYTCTYTFTASSNPVNYFYILMGDNGGITVSCIKLELGNKATDWTPAPEDMATSEDIENVQESIGDVANRVTKSESEIVQLSDSISMLVTDENGQSMMEQTSDGWTFNIGAIQNQIDVASENITGIEKDVAETSNLLSKTNDLLNDVTQKTAYINMATDDSGNPCIELGKQGNPFKLRITNTSIDFMQDNMRIAYITNRQLYIEKSVVTDEMKIGSTSGFIWRKRANGNMGLRWEDE